MKKLLSILITSLLFSSCTIIHKSIDSTVLIHIKIVKGEESGIGTCSGVYVSSNEILTASHCVGAYDPDEIIKDIWVGKNDGTSARAEIELLSPERDLCLLHTSLKGISVNLGNPVHQGDNLVVIGNPLGIPFVQTTGIVSKINFIINDNPTKHFIFDAVCLPGNSGGAAFNESGELVGIVVRSTSVFGSMGASGLGIAVSIQEIRGFLGR